MYFILLFILFFNGSSFANSDLERHQIKIWAWPGSSQIQVVDGDASILLFFKYDERSSEVEVEREVLGRKDHFFRRVRSQQEILDFIDALDLGAELHVHLYGERSIDPLGKQPSQALTVQQEQDSYRSIFKRPKIEPLFDSISWSEMRGIVKSDLSQQEIDFYLFKKTILRHLKSRSKKFVLVNLRASSCAGIL